MDKYTRTYNKIETQIKPMTKVQHKLNDFTKSLYNNNSDQHVQTRLSKYQK